MHQPAICDQSLRSCVCTKLCYCSLIMPKIHIIMSKIVGTWMAVVVSRRWPEINDDIQITDRGRRRRSEMKNNSLKMFGVRTVIVAILFRRMLRLPKNIIIIIYSVSACTRVHRVLVCANGKWENRKCIISKLQFIFQVNNMSSNSNTKSHNRGPRTLAHIHGWAIILQHSNWLPSTSKINDVSESKLHRATDE